MGDKRGGPRFLITDHRSPITMKETVYIGFGSNVGDRVDFCDRAVTLMSLLPHSQLTGVSLLYETEPVKDGSNPGDEWFLNGVVRLETEVTPKSLLSALREVERALGRNQDNRSGPRTIDLDILFYGDRIIDEADLVVPHPRLHRRRFVLMPLSELDPLLVHPVRRLSVNQMLAEVGDSSEVRLLFPQPSTRYGSRPAYSPSSGL
ncbi:2-amino-4-hydroxy-6-hydroxymethyldihydropteridine diphosphokinase [Petrachloros mirabilis]